MKFRKKPEEDKPHKAEECLDHASADPQLASEELEKASFLAMKVTGFSDEDWTPCSKVVPFSTASDIVQRQYAEADQEIDRLSTKLWRFMDLAAKLSARLDIAKTALREIHAYGHKTYGPDQPANIIATDALAVLEKEIGQ